MNGIFVAIKVIVATFASRGKFACAVGHDRLKSLFASSGQDDGPPVFGKCLRHGCSDSAAAAGDDGDSLHLGWCDIQKLLAARINRPVAISQHASRPRPTNAPTLNHKSSREYLDDLAALVARLTA